MGKKILIPLALVLLAASAAVYFLLLPRLGLICLGDPEITKFTADPEIITVGNSANLTWEIANTQHAEIDQEIGEVNKKAGTATVSPVIPTTYTLTARCGKKTATAQTTVTAEEPLKVESVTASVSPTSKTTTACATPYSFNFTGKIKASRSGTVSYQWERSDGTLGDKKSLTFSAAGTKTVTDTWPVAIGSSGWERLKVLTPEAKTSSKANFTSACQFAVTSATASVSPTSITANICPDTPPTDLTLTGKITANKAGTVKYRWYQGDTFLVEHSVTFSGAETKTVTEVVGVKYIVVGDYETYIQLRVVSPNSLMSNEAFFIYHATVCIM